MRNIFQVRPTDDGQWQALDMLEQRVVARGTSQQEVSTAVDGIAEELGNTEVMIFGPDGRLTEVREHGIIHPASPLGRQEGTSSKHLHGLEDV